MAVRGLQFRGSFISIEACASTNLKEIFKAISIIYIIVPHFFPFVNSIIVFFIFFGLHFTIIWKSMKITGIVTQESRCEISAIPAATLVSSP